MTNQIYTTAGALKMGIPKNYFLNQGTTIQEESENGFGAAT